MKKGLVYLICFFMGFGSAALYLGKEDISNAPSKQAQQSDLENSIQENAPEDTIESLTEFDLESVRASRLVDGDTFYISLRLIGIDAPERGDEYCREANAYLRQLIIGRTVRIERDVSHTDRFNRLLGYVYVEDAGEEIFVNEEMIRQGYATAADYPPDSKHKELFREAEQDARDNHKGMWQE